MAIAVTSAMILMSLGLFLPLLSDEEVFSYFSPVSVGVAMMAESRSSYSIYRNITIIGKVSHYYGLHTQLNNNVSATRKVKSFPVIV